MSRAGMQAFGERRKQEVEPPLPAFISHLKDPAERQTLSFGTEETNNAECEGVLVVVGERLSSACVDGLIGVVDAIFSARQQALYPFVFSSNCEFIQGLRDTG